jgi:hypothetical protein
MPSQDFDFIDDYLTSKVWTSNVYGDISQGKCVELILKSLPVP